MRSVATLRLVNLATGLTPGRLFQISTRRLWLGPIRSANCSSLAKTPAPVSRATLREEWTVMLFSASIVNVFMWCSLPTDYRDAHIDHSGSCHKQVNSARPLEAREGGGL